MPVRKVYEHIRRYGLLRGIHVSYSFGSESFFEWIGKRWNYGKNPLNEQWDVLVILDACRYDLFKEYVEDHSISERVDDLESRYSCGSSSREWMRKVYGNATEEELGDIHLVSANGWEPLKIDVTKFSDVTPVWELHDPEIGSIHPQDVTDAAIHAGRNTSCSRLVVHYIQPHAPFIHSPGKYGSTSEMPGRGATQNVWNGLRRGDYDPAEVWHDYGQNLLCVLDEVERLVNNVDGSTIITSDHANAIGELGIYGHPEYVPVPSLKRVPWGRLKARDEGTSNPDSPVTPGVSDTDIEAHLRNLGYMS